jgi:tetratricopeptide (TPR) repeat protein
MTNETDLRVQKLLGQIYLRENRLEEAVDVYAEVLRCQPDDVDVLLGLGNLYLASGNGRTAEQLFRRAQRIAPNSPVVENALRLALQPGERSLPEEPVPTEPAAVTRLLQRLTGKNQPIPDEEILQAAEMLRAILHSSNPANEVASHLDEIDRLLPALIELNIRQARADGKLQLAEALQNLQLNINLQKNNSQLAEEERQEVKTETFNGRIGLLLPDPQHPSAREKILLAGLQAIGCPVEVLRGFQPGLDILITCNPHLRPAILEDLARATSARVPVVVDLEADFEQMMLADPNYTCQGLGSPQASRAYTAALILANLVTVPSHALAQTFEAGGRVVEVLPDGWKREAAAFSKPGEARNLVHIGWIGCDGTLEDLATIRRSLMRVLHEFKNTRMVVIGNPDAFRLFDGVAEDRRLFLPAESLPEALAQLGQVDILVAPYRKHPYNESRSDRLLVQAGVRKIAWVASPLPAFTEWGQGGLLADDSEAWHERLRSLMLDPGLRAQMGMEGWQQAIGRESWQIGQLWSATLLRLTRRLALVGTA